MNNKVLEVNNLSIQYQTDLETVYAVNDISFSLEEGETLGLVGETGAGKTTTALGIMGLLPERTGKVPSGEILLEGQNILSLKKQEMQKIRGSKISMIFQDPMTALNPVLQVGEQIGEALYLHNTDNLSSQEIEKKVEETLELVGIPKERKVEYPYQFSGGMRQRVVIAIALICNPKLLIADEPTTALDVTIQAQILELMLEIREKRNTGILLITHDLGVVAEMCSRVIVMYAGRIVEEAPVKELFANPVHPYTQGLIASVPKLGSNVTSLPSIPGSVPDLSVMPKGCKFAPRCKYAQSICHEKEPELTYVDGSTVQRCRCHIFHAKNEEVRS